MEHTQRRIKLYRTLIGVGVAIALLSVVIALVIGAPITMAFWVPVSYGVVAWMIYRIVTDVWARAQRDRHP